MTLEEICKQYNFNFTPSDDWNRFPENKAIKVWVKAGIVFSICYTEYQSGNISYFRGYCRFPQPIFAANAPDSVTHSIDTFSGITFIRHYEDGSVVYGFDTVSFLTTFEEVERGCEEMAAKLIIATAYDWTDLWKNFEAQKKRLIAQMHQAWKAAGLP